MWVRIISYQLTDERLGEVGRTYRLVTSLLNPVKVPARALVELYHERWEIELVIDEIKTHERVERKVLRSKTPDGIKQELYGIFLAHYLVRAVMTQAAEQAGCAAERLSFTEGLFRLCEMSDRSLILHPECAPALFTQVVQQVARAILPPRRLRINRREVKQVYKKYKPKKRELAAPAPFGLEEPFLDFVALLDPLSSPAFAQVGG